MKIAVIFGGSSNEHEVSIASASSIITNLDPSKYQVTPIYLDKNNEIYEYNLLSFNKDTDFKNHSKKISEGFTYFKKFALTFIMIHGKNGEDGILSSIFEFLGLKYLANKPEASIITMNKALTKNILELNNIKTAKYLYFHKYNNEYIYQDKVVTINELTNIINNKLNYPLYVKPTKSGSSIGVMHVLTKDNLLSALNEALKIDNEILIEEEIKGHELECGILEHNKEIIASTVGEVLCSNSFYSFKEKYESPISNTIIPAKISDNLSAKIKEQAIKIFKILDLHGYSRIDFFLNDNNEIILNEINTIPGFTEISMYPKLFIHDGIPYPKLLDILINEALKKK